MHLDGIKYFCLCLLEMLQYIENLGCSGFENMNIITFDCQLSSQLGASTSGQKHGYDPFTIQNFALAGDILNEIEMDMMEGTEIALNSTSITNVATFPISKTATITSLSPSENINLYASLGLRDRLAEVGVNFRLERVAMSEIIRAQMSYQHEDSSVMLQQSGDDNLIPTQSLHGNTRSITRPANSLIMDIGTIYEEEETTIENRRQTILTSVNAALPRGDMEILKPTSTASTGDQGDPEAIGDDRRWDEILRDRASDLHYRDTRPAVVRKGRKRTKRAKAKSHQDNADEVEHRPTTNSIIYLTELIDKGEEDFEVHTLPPIHAVNDELTEDIDFRRDDHHRSIMKNVENMHEMNDEIPDQSVHPHSTQRAKEDERNEYEYNQFVLNNLEDLSFLKTNYELVHTMIKQRQNSANYLRINSGLIKRYDPKVLLHVPIEHLEVRQNVMRALVCNRAIDFTKIENINNPKSIAQAFAFIMELKSIGFIKLSEDGRKISLTPKLSTSIATNI